jgi:hypothetical protein
MVRMAVGWRGGGGATSIVGGSRATGGDGGAALKVDGDDGLVARGQRPRDEDDRGSCRGVEESRTVLKMMGRVR